MEPDDVLRLVLIAADDVDRRFDHREFARWPGGAVERFIRLGLLREAEGGLTAPCPNCSEGHVERVEIRTGPGGRTRWFMFCPESLRVDVTPEMCRGWEVDPEGLAIAIVASLGLKSAAKAIVPSRLWRLGRIPWRGKTREVVLARRLVDPDAASVTVHVPPGGRSIVLVPHGIPDGRVWGDRVPAVIALSCVASVGNEGIVLDAVALADAIEAADDLAESRSLLPIDPEVKKQVVRRQVNAELNGHLLNEAMRSAVKTHGSVRKAAKHLTETLGRPITKDQVQRAVERGGGRETLIEPDDSASVARTVASQSRDKATKFSQRR